MFVCCSARTEVHLTSEIPTIIETEGLKRGKFVQNCSVALDTSASKRSIRRFVITEKAPTRAISWLKVPNTAFTFIRHS